VRVDARDLTRYLGPPPHREDAARSAVGVVTGLAWTPMGGAILAVEAAVVHHKGRSLKLTGQLGAVMQESAEIAFAYVGSHLGELGGSATAFENTAVHVHVPAGATPKDGPSAGITIATALLSLARGQAPRPLAMTGELTLTGEVMAVGGIREKLVAARRAGVTEVILPEANRRDVAEVPAHVTDGLTLHYAGHYRDVLALAFGEAARSRGNGAAGRPKARTPRRAVGAKGR
jgi:ATP-dependent Lon protease